MGRTHTVDRLIVAAGLLTLRQSVDNIEYRIFIIFDVQTVTLL